jgi:hypothetical protein
MKLEYSPQMFEKFSNIKFHENPSIGSRVVPYGEKERRKDMMHLKVAFRDFTKAPKMEESLWQ